MNKVIDRLLVLVFGVLLMVGSVKAADIYLYAYHNGATTAYGVGDSDDFPYGSDNTGVASAPASYLWIASGVWVGYPVDCRATVDTSYAAGQYNIGYYNGQTGSAILNLLN